MSELNDIFGINEKLQTSIEAFTTANAKQITEAGFDIKGVFYTDGGCKSTDLGAWGIHGYLYGTIPTNSNSKCKSAVPTIDGYKPSAKENKANVISYIDYTGWIDNNATNNVCELLAMIKFFHLLKELNIKDVLVLADSMYVLTILIDYQKYIDNGFINSQGKPLANQDIVKEMINLYLEVKKDKEVTFKHVKGHSGDFGNDKADELCTATMNRLLNFRNHSTLVATDSPNTNRAEHNQETFVCTTPAEYFEAVYLAPKMLTEECLFTVTNAMIPLDNKRFFIGSFGEKLKARKPHQKKEFRGKPFADACIAVVELDNLPIVTNVLIEGVNQKFTDTGVIEFKLNYLTRNSIYNELAKGAWKDLLVEPDTQRMVAPDKTVVAEIIKPPRLAFNLMRDFDTISSMLTDLLNNTADDIQVVADITDKFYEITEKKGTPVFKQLANEEGVVSVETSFLVNGVAKSTTMLINIGVDVPDRVSLGRLKELEPNIKLFVFDITPRTLRYGTFIETKDGRGVWMGLYSNLHLH